MLVYMMRRAEQKLWYFLSICFFLHEYAPTNPPAPGPLRAAVDRFKTIVLVRFCQQKNHPIECSLRNNFFPEIVVDDFFLLGGTRGRFSLDIDSTSRSESLFSQQLSPPFRLEDQEFFL